MLAQRNIKPEELPVAEDIKKLERKAASEEKKIEKTTKKMITTDKSVPSLRFATPYCRS